MILECDDRSNAKSFDCKWRLLLQFVGFVFMFFRGPGRRYNKGASFGGIKWYEAGISGDVCLSDRAEAWIMLNLAFDHSWIGGTVALNCPKCGKEIRDEGFAFCPYCGAQRETTASSPSRIGSTFLRTASNIAVVLGAVFVVEGVCKFLL